MLLLYWIRFESKTWILYIHIMGRSHSSDKHDWLFIPSFPISFYFKYFLFLEQSNLASNYIFKNTSQTIRKTAFLEIAKILESSPNECLVYKERVLASIRNHLSFEPSSYDSVIIDCK